jgi:hypothetical protein
VTDPTPFNGTTTRRTTRLKALLLAVPAIVVLATAGCGSTSAGDTAAPNPTITPTTIDTPTPTPSVVASPTAAALDSFTLPATALGMAKSHDSTFNEFADGLRKGIDTQGGGVAVASVYMSKSNPRSVLVLIGVPSDLTYRDVEFQGEVYQGIAGPWNAKNRKSYPTGAMGGSMWCADGADSSLRLGICSVADNGGGFIVLYFNHNGAQTAAVVGKLRPTVEKQP